MIIMIVDDSPGVRTMIKNIFDKTSTSFCECTDGSEALEMYDHCHPDWVLMDIKMRDVNGIEATKAIISAHPDAKIMIVTQFNDSRLREKAMQAQAIDFVLKEQLWDIERIIRSHEN